MFDLAGYEILKQLAEGRVGPVYLTREVVQNRYAVVKQIVGAWDNHSGALAQYPAAAEAVERLSHPNVIAVYDLKSVDSDLLVVTEYVVGPSLRDLMDRGRLPRPAALHVLSDLSAAIEYAAERGVFHGDLKPANVFIDGSGVVRVGDFGVVGMSCGRGATDGRSGPILGTPAYMAPERASGRADAGRASDIYSLAVVAYEILLGRLPFPSVSGDAYATLDAHISDPVPRPTAIEPGFPAIVEGVLLHGLAKDPDRRPLSAGAFWSELSAAAETAWPGWTADSDLAGIAQAASPPAPPELPGPQPALVAPVPEEPELRRGVPARWIGVMLLLVALGGVALLVVPKLQVFGSGTPLQISRVIVTVSPVTGHCPSTAYLFTARVETNGQGGPVTYRWTKPMGGDTETASRSIPNGQNDTTATLEFKFQGRGATAGDAVLHILTPTDIQSAPAHISYACP